MRRANVKSQGVFYVLPPSCANNLPIREARIQIQNHTIFLPRILIGALSTKNPFHHGPSTWLLFSRSQPFARRLEEMLCSAQRAGEAPSGGISPSGLHGPGSSRAGHLPRWEASGGYPESQQRGAGMLRPLSDKGARISCTSIPPRAPGVLRTPAPSPYTRLCPAYRGLRSSLRAISGHRAPFCAVEEVVLPRTPFSRGVYISSGWSRNMARRPDRIPIRYSQEDT